MSAYGFLGDVELSRDESALTIHVGYILIFLEQATELIWQKLYQQPTGLWQDLPLSLQQPVPAFNLYNSTPPWY